MQQLGRYRLLEELGSGGFAVVYKAEIRGPEGFRSRVAIKRIHPFLTHNDPGFVRSLQNEARLCALIQHPNVVHVFELASEPDGDGRPQYYMVMELVDGPTLDILTRMAIKRDGRLPPAVLVDLLLQIARGLDHVHTLKDEDGTPLQMVHRDLKPGNVLVSREGSAKILDFGIAKAVNSAGPRTATGVTRGTAAYMSPEQAYGQHLTFASDLFSFGGILFELAVGEQLIVGDSMASQLMAVVNAPADFRADEVEAAVPGLGEIFFRLRQPAAEDRYGSTRELITALRQLRRALDDASVDPAGYLAHLIDDPEAQVSPEEIAQFKVLRTDLRAPSTATFFQVGGMQRDRDGHMVPIEEAIRSWEAEQAEAMDSLDLDSLDDDSAELAAASRPRRGRRWLWAALLLAPIALGLIAVLVARPWAWDGAPDGDAVAGGGDETAAEPWDLGGALEEIVIESDADAEDAEDGEDDGDDEAEETVADGERDGDEDGETGEPAPATDHAPGVLKINAYPAAKVYIDGQPAGSTFVTARGVSVEPGVHTVRMVRTSDGHEQTLRVEIAAGEELAVPFEWEL